MSKGKFDYSEFAKAAENMKKLQSEFNSFLEKFLLEQALIALKLVRPRTPVDTGTLRRSWQISDVSVEGSNLVVYLVNPIEYASHMEYGYRYSTKEGEKSFEGYHMAELSLLQVREQMPSKFQVAFTKWLETKGWG